MPKMTQEVSEADVPRSIPEDKDRGAAWPSWQEDCHTAQAALAMTGTGMKVVKEFGASGGQKTQVRPRRHPTKGLRVTGPSGKSVKMFDPHFSALQGLA